LIAGIATTPSAVDILGTIVAVGEARARDPNTFFMAATARLLMTLNANSGWNFTKARMHSWRTRERKLVGPWAPSVITSGAVKSTSTVRVLPSVLLLIIRSGGWWCGGVNPNAVVDGRRNAIVVGRNNASVVVVSEAANSRKRRITGTMSIASVCVPTAN